MLRTLIGRLIGAGFTLFALAAIIHSASVLMAAVGIGALFGVVVPVTFYSVAAIVAVYTHVRKRNSALRLEGAFSTDDERQAFRDLNDAHWLARNGMPYSAFILDMVKHSDAISSGGHIPAIVFDDTVMGDNPPSTIHPSHRWDPVRKGCTCGWTQKGNVPPGLEKLHFHLHMIDVGAQHSESQITAVTGVPPVILGGYQAVPRREEWRTNQYVVVFENGQYYCKQHSVLSGGIKTPPFRIDAPSFGCEGCASVATLNLGASPDMPTGQAFLDEYYDPKL